MTRATAMFSSPLAPAFKRYVDLKRAMGQRFDPQTRTLESLDGFLQNHATKYPVLNAAAFQAWCQTQEHVASGVRRVRMQQVYNFCLYRRRTEPHCFVPDPALFPKPHQRLQPYIFSEQEVAKLLQAASGLRLNTAPTCPSHSARNRRSKPGRRVPPPEIPRSSSITSTSCQPSARARSTRLYWRR
jgi:hypothetical protein